MNACTIIARNYLPHARVLAGSFLEHHPGATFTVLVVDDPGEGGGGPQTERFRVLSPYEIGIERAEMHRMALIYDVKELATAVKPFLLRQLLRDSDHAVYFDPDIEVFEPLDDIASLVRRHGIVLTPHTTDPLPRDELLPSEQMLMQAGIYNLGFVAVGRGGRAFLDWWAERLARDCIVDVERGLFVDQRWVDFVPTLFEHFVLRDPTVNVAYWNLSHRDVTRSGGSYLVNGEPLRFFHYSGFSPDHMDRLSLHMGDIPRIVFEDVPDVHALCEEYASKLRQHGYGVRGAPRYRFDELPNGLPVTSDVRRDVRLALVAAERAGEATAPDPFDPRTADAFLDWLAEPVGPSRIPRQLAALYERRRDLRHAFPEVTGGSGRAFLAWAYATRAERPGIPDAVLDRASPDAVSRRIFAELEGRMWRLSQRHRWLSPLVVPYRPLRRVLVRRPHRSGQVPGAPLVTVPDAPPLPGVNVAGYLRAELGVGENARLLIAGLEAGEIPHATITYSRTVSRQKHPFERGSVPALYDTNVVCVNADQLANFRADAPELFSKRYTIGLWAWELSRFPPSMHGAFELVDEVWVPSEFVRDAIAAETARPVRVVPLPVVAPDPPTLTRADVGLPDEFSFLFSFDFLSVPERKNPCGLVDAFTRAFAPSEGPVLVIKTINGDKSRSELERLRRRAGGRPDVLVVDEYLSAAERDALMALCDCYVSLHRSEGYGLTMAEAMAAARPVIATGYSGNTTFMDESNSLVVPYRLTEVPAGCDPYPVGAEWAEPDLDAAARLMRRVWERPDEARRLGRRAQEDILGRNPLLRTAGFVTRRLEELRDEREARSGRATGSDERPGDGNGRRSTTPGRSGPAHAHDGEGALPETDELADVEAPLAKQSVEHRE